MHHATGPGAGYFCGVTADGRVFVRDLEQPLDAAPAFARKSLPGVGPVRLTVELAGNGRLNVGAKRGDAAAFLSAEPPPAGRLRGSIGLVSHPGSNQKGKARGRWAFSEWFLSGPALARTPDDARLGPILGTKYTLDAGSSENGGDGNRVIDVAGPVLAARLGGRHGDEAYEMTARLELDRGNGFEPAATAPITRPDWTAIFKVENFDAAKAVPYRVVYALADSRAAVTTGADGRRAPTRTAVRVAYQFPGVVRADPAGGTVVLAALSCNNNTRGAVDKPRYSFTPDAPLAPARRDPRRRLEGRPGRLLFRRRPDL